MRKLKHLSTFVAVAAMLVCAPISTAAGLQDYIDRTCKSGCVGAMQLMRAVYAASDSYGIDPRAVLSIVSVESSFKSRASNGTSVGLTQVLARLHRDKFRGNDYFDVQDNIFAGVQVLSACLRKHKGDYSRAYSCYNGYGKQGAKYSIKVQQVYRKLSSVELESYRVDHLGGLLAKLSLVEK